NQVTGSFGTVSGGRQNTAHNVATVGGGVHNTASGTEATVGGGLQNTASALDATVSGGINNTASSVEATVSGGANNTASARDATVPGGSSAVAGLFGQMAYASGQFAATGDAQTSLFVLRNTTTNVTQKELFLDGSVARITLAAGRTMTFDVLIA